MEFLLLLLLTLLLQNRETEGDGFDVKRSGSNINSEQASQGLRRRTELSKAEIILVQLSLGILKIIFLICQTDRINPISIIKLINLLIKKLKKYLYYVGVV